MQDPRHLADACAANPREQREFQRVAVEVVGCFLPSRPGASVIVPVHVLDLSEGGAAAVFHTLVEPGMRGYLGVALPSLNEEVQLPLQIVSVDALANGRWLAHCQFVGLTPRMLWHVVVCCLASSGAHELAANLLSAGPPRELADDLVGTTAFPDERWAAVAPFTDAGSRGQRPVRPRRWSRLPRFFQRA